MTTMLSNPEKAVLFLLSLDEAVARPIIDELKEEDLRRLRSVAETMRVVPKDAIMRTCEDFLKKSDAMSAVPNGGIRYLRQLSVGSLGEAKARALFEDRGPSAIDRLEAAPAEDVASLLSREPPQLAAAVVSVLSPATAAKILGELDEEHKALLVKYMGRMKQLPMAVIEDVANALVTQLPENEGAAAVLSIDGVARTAELLNASSKTASTAILAKLEAEDPDLAASVRQAMFTFDDLVRLDSRAMRTLLREVPTDRLTIALRGAAEVVASAIYAGLSSRAADLIRDDLANMGHVRKTEIEAARKEILDAARKLEESGQISLGRGDE